MQKQQVFKVKGMQRDASMANANGEFAYEILNMRLMPAEDLSGFSLTNEKGTTEVITGINGQVIGQCPTNDSLVVFTTDTQGSHIDYIYEIWEGIGEDKTEEGWNEIKWRSKILYSGNLNFSADYPIEALFNYETEDIQKVYWIDGLNQLRCINLVGDIKQNNDQQFDSVKEINSVPSVEIERVIGGNFTAGVVQYYVTYFNKNASESPIVYTSPLLYIAHNNRGANVNDRVSTAFKLTFTDLDTTNWEYMRIYATHRTSIDATPEASIVIEVNMNNSTIEFTDYGSNRTSIAPTDLYFTGGKFVKAGTMTVKDQVMFLGHFNIESPNTIDLVKIQEMFNILRNEDNQSYFSTNTRKQRENNLEEYEDTHYYYKNQLNNTEPITHYKYGEKYRFGISLMDSYGNWSNPVWIKDAFIEVPPEQVDKHTLELPCPQLNLSVEVSYVNTNNETVTSSLWEFLQSCGAKNIKPLVVFPTAKERKVIAQGVVCPTVYNLKDRKENGPYAQASWFMRPNAPVDLWGIKDDPAGIQVLKWNGNTGQSIKSQPIYHYSDLITSHFDNDNRSEDPRTYTGYFGAASVNWESINRKASSHIPKPYVYMLDDGNAWDRSPDASSVLRLTQYNEQSGWYISSDTSLYSQTSTLFFKDVVQHGVWLEFRHNYALRSKGWSFGHVSGGVSNGDWKGVMFGFGKQDSNYDREYNDSNDYIFGGYRAAEIGSTRFHYMLPVNRVTKYNDKLYFRNKGKTDWDVDSNFITGNSAFYVDNSIVTLNTPEIELSETIENLLLQDCDFRIIGIIPLTATVSDMSLEINNPSPNSDSLDVGLKVVHTTNKNIGHHGFKGIVSANAYFSDPKDSDYDYRTVLLNPWHTAGTLQAVSNTSDGFGDSETLKRKVLSNLRYSASSYYFNSSNLIIPDLGNSSGPLSPSEDLEELNRAYLSSDKSRLIGWKPAKGVVSEFWTNQDDTGIIKLMEGKQGLDLVYRGNIDIIATATFGDSNPAYIMPSHSKGSTIKNDYMNPVFYSNTDHQLFGKGASIKYKSSPHIVVAFKEFAADELWNKKTQEILPALRNVNTTGLSSGYRHTSELYTGGEQLYEDETFNSIPHQSQLSITEYTYFGLPMLHPCIKHSLYGSYSPSYGWLWLGELYRVGDPTFGGTSEYAFANNNWETAGTEDSLEIVSTQEISVSVHPDCAIKIINESIVPDFADDVLESDTITDIIYQKNENTLIINISYIDKAVDVIHPDGVSHQLKIGLYYADLLRFLNSEDTEISVEAMGFPIYEVSQDSGRLNFKSGKLVKVFGNSNLLSLELSSLQSVDTEIEPIEITDTNSLWDYPFSTFTLSGLMLSYGRGPGYYCCWTQGDTYYQRFDTLKTYAYSDSDQNSVVDITSFMVETRINIDGRTDRNRGQESNLQMSPTNFNLMNDIYSQRDNFFTYRILDEDLQARTNFPNQITWSLTKTAGATVDAWMNITLASVLDLDGTKGKISALKNFNNNIIAFQEKGLSHIMFNSRAQIATSEAVPIQIANTGKVDGQQYFTTDVGCQDKWNIVTTPNGLYFIDYFNKGIYKFNGQLEDISTPNGFRSWCYENLNSTANIIGYYDVKNKEVMYYIGDTSFELSQHYLDGEDLEPIKPQWLGFSELTNAFSSFYTYPKAWFANVQDQGLWLLSGDTGTPVFTHQTGEYNHLLNTSESFYGLTVIPRQDSNTVKTFNNVEFRADSYNGSTLDNNHTFDTISAETEYQTRTTGPLTYSQYRPSNLKKKLRTWRANIPRVNNGYNRFVNQWAKIGLWKMNPSTEKTILHDLSVWYSE